MDQQRHNLPVEVTRLRTLADHSYRAINDLLLKADVAKRDNDLVIEALYHILGVSLNQTVGNERRVVFAMFMKVGKIIDKEKGCFDWIEPKGDKITSRKDTIAQIKYDLSRAQADAEGLREKYVSSSRGKIILNQIVGDLQRHVELLKEMGQ